MDPTAGTRPSVAPAGIKALPALLVAEELITDRDLAIAKQHATHEHVELQDALVALGLISELDVYRALARAAGIDLADLDAIEPSELAIRLLPERVARLHQVAPLQADHRSLVYATSRPFDTDTQRDVSLASGRQAKPVLAIPSSLLSAIERCYARPWDVSAAQRRRSRHRPR